jgi:hypothetical protein
MCARRRAGYAGFAARINELITDELD